MTYCCISHIGKCRKMNQDNFLCDGIYLEEGKEAPSFPLTGTLPKETAALLGVFDGMGGEECGEVASLLAAQTFSSLALSGDLPMDLLDGCREANRRICGYILENGLSAMGTTAALAAFSPEKIVFCNIGDSRIYRYAKGELLQLSEDHVASYYFGRKPPLTQNLGIFPSDLVIEPYVTEEEYQEGAKYLLCSDGLTDMVPEEQIRELMAVKPLKEAAEGLLDLALTNGGRDNITLLLCETG